KLYSKQHHYCNIVTHHSIELSWMNEENKPRNGPPERWTRFSVEQMDPKTHTYSTVYIGYSTHHLVEGLESSTSYNFRLRVTRASVECSLSPVVSVFTTREIFYCTSSQSLGLLFSYFKSSKSHAPLCSQKGFTSLMQACFAGHLNTVKYLRNCGSTWQSGDTDGCTPLHWAVDGGHLPVITYMIQDGCEVDVMDKVSLWTPLMCVSAISGNAAVASILLQAGADVNIRDKAGKTPLMQSSLTTDKKQKQKK
uniref:Fibronectin type 3 and ankyrin repeat domains protein 1-like n=1 Tax=Sinocyclocheilus anshuiensis TaxID=1608454 RepID=A0A671NEW3_9TELE